MERPRVVIVGAGFGGITAAKALASAPVEVTVVDRNNFHTFSPLLYQVVTAGLAPEDIAPNARGIIQRFPNIEARLGTVVGVDFDRREVLVEPGEPIPYDSLVLAAGAVSSDFGVPGVAEHALALKTLADAIRIRSAVLRRFEEVDVGHDADDGTVTFVVAGGGPTGVELAGALAELITRVLAKDFKRLDVTRARVVLVEMADHLLGGFSPASQVEAKRELEQRGVEVRLGASITAVTERAVHLGDGSSIPTRTVVWAVGVKANPLADALLGLPQSPRGEIVVGPDLTVVGRPEVFVIGDLASARRPDGTPLPQLAPVAMQAGRHIARRIAANADPSARRRRRKAEPFRYVDKGTMATIGRRSAVAELPFGIRFGGTLGWLSWLGLHLVFLIGFRHRVVVLVNWAWNYVRWDRGNRLILTESDD